MTVHYQVHTDVAVLTLDLPPVNSLGLAMRQALAAGLQRQQVAGGIAYAVGGRRLERGLRWRRRLRDCGGSWCGSGCSRFGRFF